MDRILSRLAVRTATKASSLARQLLLVVGAALGLDVFAGQAAAQGVLFAVGDQRVALLNTASGGAQDSASGSTSPPESQFAFFGFDDCAVAGAASACIETTSSFLGFLPTFSSQGFFAKGRVRIVNPGPGSAALAVLLIDVDFGVTGLQGNQTHPAVLSGWLNGNTPYRTISLTGPGVNITITETSLFQQPLALKNGQYTLSVDMASFSGSEELALDHESAFSVSLRSLANAPALCSNASGSCFHAHEPAGCDEPICCSLVCIADSFCCNNSWDNLCATQAREVCVPAFDTGEVRNPVNGHAYRRTTPHDYDATKAVGAASGYTPADIRSGKENEFVRRWLASPLPSGTLTEPRVGLHDRFLEGIFVWESGFPLDFTRWATGQPDDAGGDEDTVAMLGSSGRWVDLPDSADRALIVERSFNACGTAAGSCTSTHGPGCNDVSCCNEICFADPHCCQVAWDASCVNAAVTYCANALVGAPVVNPATGSRYYLVSAGSWLQAEKRAAGMNGTLVSIGSAAENQWVFLNFVNTPGLPNQVWIGLTDQTDEGLFRWSNGAPVTYTNWGPTEPNQNGNEDFVMMNDFGVWNDTPNGLSVGAVIEVPCAGDLTGDGVVDGPDLGMLLGQWGLTGAADLTLDGIVDAADLSIVLGGWGSCPTSNACFARSTPGSDQPGCTICVCAADPFCCSSQWDSLCAQAAAGACNAACQCGE